MLGDSSTASCISSQDCWNAENKPSLVDRVKTGIEEANAKALIQEELGGTIFDGLDAETRLQVAATVLSGLETATAPSTRMTKDDFRGAIGIFAVEFITAFMLVLPFFFLPADSRLAFILSNSIGMVMLFSIGCAWGKHMNRKILSSGLVMLLIGLVIFALTMVLGG